MAAKDEYLIPQVVSMVLLSKNLVCISPPPGGSEGTGDEPLFGAPSFFDLGIGGLF